MVSIKDIARAAHVSHSTVSRALRDSPLVNAETRELIQRIAAEQGYTVSAVARSLVTRRTNTIGVVVTSIADPFVGEVVGGVEEFAVARQYSVILATCHGDPDRELRAVRSLQERRVDGILVAASRVGALYLPVLQELKAPLVLINNQYPGEFGFHVSIDNPAGARQITSHLIELGHRRIAYIGDRFGLHSDTERCEVIAKASKTPASRTTPSSWPMATARPRAACTPCASFSASPTRPPPSSATTTCRRSARCAPPASAASRAPPIYRLPASTTSSSRSYTDPPLTTIRQPKQEMGCDAAEILLDLLAGGEPRSIVKQGALVVRESTAPRRRLSLLELHGITKAFGGFRVLEGVDLDVRPAEVHALAGENGAGKSTLMNIVSGVLAGRQRRRSNGKAARSRCALRATRKISASPSSIRNSRSRRN